MVGAVVADVYDLSAFDHGTDLIDVFDVGERIGVKDDEIAEAAGLNRADLAFLMEKLGVVFRAGLERLHGGEAGVHEHAHLLAEGQSGSGGSTGSIGAGENAPAGFCKARGELKGV